MNKMNNKKTILLFVGALAVVTIAIYFWADNLLKEAEENTSKSNTIAPAIRNLFSRNQSVDDYAYKPAKPEWQRKYVILENRYSDSMNAQYSTNWNKELDTDKYFPGTEAKGVVMIALVVTEEGSYESTFGSDTHKKALRQSYVISYLDIAQKVVLARDTLRGEDPPKNIRSTESGLGDAPDENLVISTIKKRLG